MGMFDWKKIFCVGYIIRKEERSPVEKIVEYSYDGKEKLSQLASVQFSIENLQYELNVHDMKASGETVISISKWEKSE